jgi:CheY-like chemotaxis protein
VAERPPRILVVDDIPENRRLLEAVLAPRGYDVVTASDGLAALEVVESEQPDLILLDVMMPGLDGYSVCRRLRENEDTAVLPVIMVTSSLSEEKTRAIEAGAATSSPSRSTTTSCSHGFARCFESSATTTRSRRRRPSSPSSTARWRNASTTRSKSSVGYAGWSGSSRRSSRAR